jgi:hypothetical protein
MRFEELVANCSSCPRPGSTTPRSCRQPSPLRTSLDDLRNIAAGLGLPGIAGLPLADTVRRAVRDFERQAEFKVAAEIEPTLPDADWRPRSPSIDWSRNPSPTPQARPRGRGGRASLACRRLDARRGRRLRRRFQSWRRIVSGRLGLAFMQERVRLLGGRFELESEPGRGTRVHAIVPLTAAEVRHG